MWWYIKTWVLRKDTKLMSKNLMNKCICNMARHRCLTHGRLEKTLWQEKPHTEAAKQWGKKCENLKIQWNLLFFLTAKKSNCFTFFSPLRMYFHHPFYLFTAGTHKAATECLETYYINVQKLYLINITGTIPAED